MIYLVALSLSISAYCLITSELKYRKRLKKHKRGDVIDFSGGVGR